MSISNVDSILVFNLLFIFFYFQKQKKKIKS